MTSCKVIQNSTEKFDSTLAALISNSNQNKSTQKNNIQHKLMNQLKTYLDDPNFDFSKEPQGGIETLSNMVEYFIFKFWQANFDLNNQHPMLELLNNSTYKNYITIDAINTTYHKIEEYYQEFNALCAYTDGNEEEFENKLNLKEKLIQEGKSITVNLEDETHPLKFLTRYVEKHQLDNLVQDTVEKKAAKKL